MTTQKPLWPEWAPYFVKYLTEDYDESKERIVQKIWAVKPVYDPNWFGWQAPLEPAEARGEGLEIPESLFVDGIRTSRRIIQRP